MFITPKKGATNYTSIMLGIVLYCAHKMQDEHMKLCCLLKYYTHFSLEQQIIFLKFSLTFKNFFLIFQIG